VAIQTAFPLALAFQTTEPPRGLPRRFAPRNDEVGGLARYLAPGQETNNRLSRHCEGRRPVAIQTAFPLALAFQKTEPPHGLPRRCAPRNDELEGERMDSAFALRLARFLLFPMASPQA
jgi:hypothetical protein